MTIQIFDLKKNGEDLSSSLNIHMERVKNSD